MRTHADKPYTLNPKQSRTGTYSSKRTHADARTQVCARKAAVLGRKQAVTSLSLSLSLGQVQSVTLRT